MLKNTFLAAALASALVVGGCSIGNAPEPMSEGDVKAALDKATPEQQIDWVNRSPMPPAEKQRRIAEIKAKAGMATDSPGAASPHGAPTGG